QNASGSSQEATNAYKPRVTARRGRFCRLVGGKSRKASLPGSVSCPRQAHRAGKPGFTLRQLALPVAVLRTVLRPCGLLRGVARGLGCRPGLMLRLWSRLMLWLRARLVLRLRVWLVLRRRPWRLWRTGPGLGSRLGTRLIR